MGRHSAPDDYGDDTAAVLSAPPAPSSAPSSRPRPGRHSRGDEAPAPPPEQGLDVIEIALAGDGEAHEPPAAGDESATAQIEPIVDPVLDQPVPAAETTVLSPVPTEDGDDAADDAVAAADAVGGADAVDEKSAKAAAKAAVKARRKAERAEAKQAKQDDKQARQSARAEAKRAGRDTPSPAPGPTAPAKTDKVSDLVLLRTDPAARARVIAAVVVPFVLYVGVLLVIGSLDLRTALIWIWVPLISAGIVAGLILDLAHRAAAVRAVEALERRLDADADID